MFLHQKFIRKRHTKCGWMNEAKIVKHPSGLSEVGLTILKIVLRYENSPVWGPQCQWYEITSTWSDKLETPLVGAHRAMKLVPSFLSLEQEQPGVGT